MGSDALMIDADGLPPFRPDSAVARQAIDAATALKLEQESLTLDGLGASLMTRTPPADQPS